MTTLVLRTAPGDPAGLPSAGSTTYAVVGQSWLRSGVEASAEHPIYKAGVLSNLWVKVTVNGRTGAGSVKSRKNGAAGNQTVTIPATTTGEFEDVTNSDTITSGDTAAWEVVTGTGGTRCDFVAIQGLFEHTGGAYNPQIANHSALSVAANVTRYHPVGAGGNAALAVTEARASLKSRGAGTYRDLYYRVSANTQSTAITVTSRVNGAAGNMTVTVPASTTGNFEDTSNSDTVAVDDLYGLEYAGGGGTGSATVRLAGAHFEADSGGAHALTAWSYTSGDAGVALPEAVRYGMVGGGAIELSTTESLRQAKPRMPVTASGFGAYIGVNSRNNATVFTYRKNGADTPLTFSVGGGTTGWVENTADVVTLDPDDEDSFSTFTDPAGSGAIEVFTIRCIYNGDVVVGSGLVVGWMTLS